MSSISLNEMQEIINKQWYEEYSIYQILKMKRVEKNTDAVFINFDENYKDTDYEHGYNDKNLVIFRNILVFSNEHDEYFDKFKEIVEKLLLSANKGDNTRRMTFATALLLNGNHYIPLIFNTDGEIIVGNSIANGYDNNTIMVVNIVSTAIEAAFGKNGIENQVLDAQQRDEHSCGPITVEVISGIDPNKSLAEQKEHLNSIQNKVSRNYLKFRKSHQSYIKEFYAGLGISTLIPEGEENDLFRNFIILLINEAKNSRKLNKDTLITFLEKNEISINDGEAMNKFSQDLDDYIVKIQGYIIKQEEDESVAGSNNFLRPFLKALLFFKKIVRKIIAPELADSIYNSESKPDDTKLKNSFTDITSTSITGASVTKTRPDRP